jgi:hypothetical protein
MRDPYVAAMKGVLHTMCPGAQIEDLSHEIGPQDILEAALFWAASVPYFPPGTIHVGVVDPGVGTGRRPIVLQVDDQVLVCPDNGMVGLLLHCDDTAECRVISHPSCRRENVSATFHGRDIFAPTAARLAAGFPFEEVGEAIDDYERLELPAPTLREDGVLVGTVIHVDRFGNAVTNVHNGALNGRVVQSVHAAELPALPMRHTYGEVDAGEALALVGSAGYLEIAVNQGNAAETFNLTPGSPVEISFA